MDGLDIVARLAPVILAVGWILFVGLAGWHAARLAAVRSRSITGWSIATALCPIAGLVLLMLPSRDGRAISGFAARLSARDRQSDEPRGALAGTTPACRYGELP